MFKLIHIYLKLIYAITINTLQGINIYNVLLSILVILIAILLKKPLQRILKVIVNKTISSFNILLGANFDVIFQKAVNVPIKLILFVSTAAVIIKIFGISLSNQGFINQILKTLIIIALSWFLYFIMDIILVVETFILNSQTKIDMIISRFAVKLTKIIVVIISGLMIMRVWEWDITGLIAGLGIGGVAVALGAKDTLANFFGSIMIMLDKPFAIGDMVKTSHAEGIIEEIGFRSTKIRIWDQAIVTIPNAIISNDPTTNWSRMGKRRINFTIHLPYTCSLELVDKCINQIREMLGIHEMILNDNIFVFLENIGDSSIEVFIQCFTNAIEKYDYLKVKEDINFKILNIIGEQGVQIALPSYHIYSKENKE